MGLEVIVSKRAGSRYSSGNSRQWLKSKKLVFDPLHVAAFGALIPGTHGAKDAVVGLALVQTAGSGPAMMSAELPEGGHQLFEGRHFDREVIILCVRWYLRFKLSLRDLVEMMAERGLSLAHTTIMRWVWRYAPELRSAGSGSPRRSAGHGGWTRHTSKFEANGAISIVPWIGRGGRLTSG